MSKKIVLLVVAVLCLLFSWSLVMAQEKAKEEKSGTILLVPLIGEKHIKTIAEMPKVSEKVGEPSSEIQKALGIGVKDAAERPVAAGMSTKLTPFIERKKLELEKLVKYFEKFDVETIEVWVEGVTEANILVVSLGGNAGIKVILKPKKTEPQKPPSKK